jgi:hypothetical protein
MLPFYRIDAAAGIGSGRIAFYACVKGRGCAAVFIVLQEFEFRNALPADAVLPKSSRGTALERRRCGSYVRPVVRHFK